MLGNLKELYQEFKEKHPTDKIGFSKFADLRPKHCILAGARGARTVCVLPVTKMLNLWWLVGKLLNFLPMMTFHWRNIIIVLQKSSAIHLSQIVIYKIATHALGLQA